jgi:hypothetical protein
LHLLVECNCTEGFDHQHIYLECVARMCNFNNIILS